MHMDGIATAGSCYQLLIPTAAAAAAAANCAWRNSSRRSSTISRFTTTNSSPAAAASSTVLLPPPNFSTKKRIMMVISKYHHLPRPPTNSYTSFMINGSSTGHGCVGSHRGWSWMNVDDTRLVMNSCSSNIIMKQQHSTATATATATVRKSRMSDVVEVVLHDLVGSSSSSLDSVNNKNNGVGVVGDVLAAVSVLAGAYALVRSFDTLTTKQFLDQKLSRKLVHIISGLLFMSSWPLFSSSTDARFFAAFVPFCNFMRLLIYGLALAKDESLVKSVTREGNAEELLRGPLYYVLVLMISCLVFWRDSPVGVIAITMMCTGDGVADIVGRRFGSLKLPFNEQKSWAGSLSMFSAGALSSFGMLLYFSSFGYFHLDWTSTVWKVVAISLVATIVESLPVTKLVDDNISVPLTSMLMGHLLFGYFPY